MVLLALRTQKLFLAKDKLLVNSLFMKPYQQLYRVLVIIWGFLIFWNLIISVVLVLGAAVTHPSQIMWDALLVWFWVSIIGVIIANLTIKDIPIIKNYGLKSVVMIIMVFASIIPSTPFLFSSQISSYINYWESIHCVQIGQPDQGFVNIKCDNGDTVEKSLTDTRRLGAGYQNMHYPYNFFY